MAGVSILLPLLSATADTIVFIRFFCSLRSERNNCSKNRQQQVNMPIVHEKEIFFVKIYYFNATHWDREWYLPKEGFRKYLLDMTEQLLDIFDNDPNFKKFTFDGQTIVLEDILEIHPEWRSRLETLIQSGKLMVGPWYVMPDEFLVSGEALIRNLQLGRKIARTFGGEAWQVGYACDMFGHTGQLPQILSGFNMTGTVVWRGIPDDFGPYFLWKSPDGTLMPAVHLIPHNGYGQFALEVRGLKNEPLDEAVFKKQFSKWYAEFSPYWGEAMILSDGLDHAEPNRDTMKMLGWIQECCPDAEIIHTDYREVFESEFATEKKRPILSGELISPVNSRQNIVPQISATLSSRYDIKFANDNCQNTLELEIEPRMAAESVSSTNKFDALLNYAWKHLLQNHAHDSICGCSPDEVHRHMHTRFEEVAEVAKQLTQELNFRDLERLTGDNRWKTLHTKAYDEAEKALLESDSDGKYLLRIYNPLPYAVSEVREIEIQFPATHPYPQKFTELFGCESVNNFELLDEVGDLVDYSIRSIKRRQVLVRATGTSRFYDLYRVILPVNLRASGWTELTLRPVIQPVRNFQSLASGMRSATNGIISLQIESDGTYSVTDLRNGRTYVGQNDYRIDREVGDGWGHIVPVANAVTVGGECKSIRIVHDGPARIEFEIIKAYTLPKEMAAQAGYYENYVGIAESSEKVTLEIKTVIGMDRNSDQVRVHTEIDNNLCDYRLQLLIPTGIMGNYFANQAFCMVERTPGRGSGRKTENYFEPESPDKNFHGIIGKKDAAGGFAFISKSGLHECGALENSATGELTVTLLRAFRRTVEQNGEYEGQLQRKLHFDYLLKCLTPETEAQHLAHTQQLLRTGSPATQLIASHLVQEHKQESFVTLSGNLTFSALKPAANGVKGEIIFRAVNLSAERAAGEIVFCNNFRRAELCHLNETVECTLADTPQCELELQAEPWKIITVKLIF